MQADLFVNQDAQKLIDDLINQYELECDQGGGHINHQIRHYLNQFVQDLKQIKKTLGMK